MMSVNGLSPKFNYGAEWDYVFLLFNDWWNQIINVMQNKNIFTRKSLILEVANKEAAHIDLNISKELKSIEEGYWRVTKKTNGKVHTQVINYHHLLLIRQIAWEILNSNELLKLIK